MVSSFKDIVMSFVSGKKEMKAYKPEEKARDIEKALDEGKIDLPGAMVQLRAVFRYDLSDDDYREIEKQVGYNIRK